MEKVFLNSLPKAGTNLASKCLELFGYALDGHLGAAWILTGSYPQSLLRRIRHLSAGQGYLLGINHPVEVSRRSVDRLLERVVPGRYVTAHVGYTDDVLRRVEAFEFKRILMVRDPRGVVASFVPYVLNQSSHPLHNTFAAMKDEERYHAAAFGCYSDKFISGQSIFSCCNALDAWFQSDQVLVIRFEDLVGSKGGGSMDAQQETLSRLCKHVAADEAKIPWVQEKLFGPGKHTFRKGKIEAWRDEIPPEIQDKLNEKLAPVLHKWGYE